MECGHPGGLWGPSTQLITVWTSQLHESEINGKSLEHRGCTCRGGSPARHVSVLSCSHPASMQAEACVSCPLIRVCFQVTSSISLESPSLTGTASSRASTPSVGQPGGGNSEARAWPSRASQGERRPRRRTALQVCVVWRHRMLHTLGLGG